MSFWKRACLHTIRKKAKTTLMFLILLVISTLILTCLAVQSATRTAALNIRKSLMGGFTVNAMHTGTLLDDSAVSHILETSGMNARYNLRSYFYAEYRGKDGKKLKLKTEGAANITKGFEHVGKIAANTQSDMDTYFTEAGFKLVQGRHISKTDRNVILVSNDFAARNGLKPGDSILLGDNRTDKQVEVKIIGIFAPAKNPISSGAISHSDFYENVGFTDNSTYSQHDFGDGRNHYQYGDFFAEDPAELDHIIENVKKLPSMAWEDCRFTKNDADYQNAKSELLALLKLVTVIILILIAASILMLTLILFLWIRNRMQEIGMLLAMGIRRGNIMLQHITEILLIAIFAFALSFVTSSFIAQNAGDELFDRASGKDRVTEKNLTAQTEEELKADEAFTPVTIRIKVSFSDLALIYCIGTGVILFSIVLASYPILQIKPKHILTKTS